MDTYGKELIIDLKDCDPTTFNRDSLTEFFTELCDRIDVEQGDLHFWDDLGDYEDGCKTDPNLKGTSAVQFIMMGSIVIRCHDQLGTVYGNLFSCNDFKEEATARFIRKWFEGAINHVIMAERD
jgi:hypothetical protein